MHSPAAAARPCLAEKREGTARVGAFPEARAKERYFAVHEKRHVEIWPAHPVPNFTVAHNETESGSASLYQVRGMSFLVRRR